MKVDSLLLGHFVKSSDDRHPFYLYRMKDSAMLLFKLVDVCSFFNLPELTVSSLPPDSFCDEQQDIYLSTPALTQVAIKHNKFLLAELCKLKPSDYAANLADSILSTMPSLECSKDYKKNNYSETNISISPLSPSHQPVKSEPLSPPLPSAINNTSTTTIRKSDPMALDSMLTHHTNGAGSQSRKQSRPIEDISNTTTPKKQRLNEERNLLPKPAHTVSSQQAPPTLLAKRLSGKNARKLTIYAPSYNEQFQAGIRSAPLNSNFRQQQQQQQKKQPHPLSHQTVPNKQKRKAEFAIPPIVPSQQQQQPPHTAHHFPRSPLLHPTSAFAHSFPITSGRIKENGNPSSSSASSSSSSATSSSATSSVNVTSTMNHSSSTTATPLCQTPPSLQRQQFMQPFEHLFDTIETTRTLKSTLDDQIRRSSTLIQTLQASSTTIEGLIRNHIKEIQKESMQRMDDKLADLNKRMTALETGKKLIHPPTIVRSQNDINPKEYHTMLNTLLDRLDKLESQLES